MGGGGGVEEVVSIAVVVESEDEAVEFVWVWSCVDGVDGWVFDSVELDEDA